MDEQTLKVRDFIAKKIADGPDSDQATVDTALFVFDRVIGIADSLAAIADNLSRINDTLDNGNAIAHQKR
jgi:hypothetical protein